MAIASSNYPRAALLALTAFTCWVFSDALLKQARTDHVPQGQILLICGLSGMAIVFLLSVARGGIARLRPTKWSGLAALGLCQWTNFTCWLVALPNLPLANMYAVAFLTPMMVAGLAAVILKERLDWKRAAAIATGFTGVVIAIDPSHLLQHQEALTSYLALFGSMLTSSGQMLLLRSVGRYETSECTAFYPRLALIAAGLFYGATSGMTAISPVDFLAICGAGVLSGLGWSLLAQAYQNASAAAVAPFHYSQIITGAILGYLVWGNIPTHTLIIGAAIIMASGIVLVHRERRISRTLTRAD